MLVSIGSILLVNGLFHVSFYLLDDKALFEGLRYFNWLSLVLGPLLSIYSYNQLNKPLQSTV